jgi:hypothetical protein
MGEARPCASWQNTVCDAIFLLFSTYIYSYINWEELTAHIPLIPHGKHRKRRVQQFFYCCVYSLPRERVYRETIHTDTQTDGRDL